MSGFEPEECNLLVLLGINSYTHAEKIHKPIEFQCVGEFFSGFCIVNSLWIGGRLSTNFFEFKKLFIACPLGFLKPIPMGSGKLTV